LTSALHFALNVFDGSWWKWGGRKLQERRDEPNFDSIFGGIEATVWHCFQRYVCLGDSGPPYRLGLCQQTKLDKLLHLGGGVKMMPTPGLQIVDLV